MRSKPSSTILLSLVSGLSAAGVAAALLAAYAGSVSASAAPETGEKPEAMAATHGATAHAAAGSEAARPSLAAGEAPAPASAAPSRTAPAAAEIPDVPEDIRTALEAAMTAKLSTLYDEKNEDGQPYKRGTFSRRFHKVDDETYQVTSHRDTASKDTLTTERFLVTLKKDPSDKWKVASEDLQDTYKNLFRSVPGTEEFQAFESFSFAREGIRITGGKGVMFKSLLRGKPEGFGLVADGLAYEYEPPDTKYAGLYRKLKKDHAVDVVFPAEFASAQCDEASCEEILASSFKGLAPSTRDKLGDKLRDAYDDYIDKFKKARKDNPFSGFRRPLDPDRRYWSVQVEQGKTPDHGIALDYDSWNPKEVSFEVFGLDKFYSAFGLRPFYAPVYSYYSEATLKKGVNPYDLELRDDANARDIDLTGLKGTVELGLEDAERLDADIRFTLRTKRELREIPFFIRRLRQTEKEQKESKNPQLVINSIEDGEGHDLTWVKTGLASGLVVLGKPLPAGSPFTLHMRFQNKSAIYNFSSSFSYVDRFGWLPFVRFTDMITDFDLTTKVPARYTPLGIGRKESEKVEKGVKTTHWVADSPVEFPSITFGDYNEREAEVKATKIDGTRIPVKVHVDKAGILSDTMGREYFPVTPKALQDVADTAANSLNVYREIFGVDYPYGKLDLVNDPLGAFYGQSPSSLVYLGEGTFYSQGVAGEIGGSQISKFNREVVPHEVGHQWWGSLIPNANDENYWFVESLAEYSAALFVEATEGKEAYRDKVERWRRRILEVDLQSSVQDASTLWAGELGAGYQAAVYNKGPYAFHVMRMTWGDEKFFKFLKMLAQDLKNKAIVTRDIQKEAEKAFGGNMEFFFDEWLRGVGQPEYTFTYGVRQTEDGKFLVEGQVDQRVLVGKAKDVLEGKYFTAIVPVTVVGKGGKEYRVPLRIEGPRTPFKFKVDEKPKEVIFNKNGESLAYDVIVKQTTT